MEIDSVLNKTKSAQKNISEENVDDYNLRRTTGNQYCIYRGLLIGAKETTKYRINMEVVFIPQSAHLCL